jgi:hypothetical protein
MGLKAEEGAWVPSSWEVRLRERRKEEKKKKGIFSAS